MLQLSCFSFSVNGQVNPALGHNNTRLYTCVLGEQMEEICTVRQFERLAFCEFKCRFSITASGH
jgi:hypothetical protein